MILFQHFLVLSIFSLHLTKSEKDKLSNKPILTETESYSTDMFLNDSSGQYNSHLLFKRDTNYIYNESTVKPQNSIKSNTERFNKTIVVSSEVDTFHPIANRFRNQTTLAFQFNYWYIHFSNLSVLVPFNYESPNCLKLYSIVRFARWRLYSFKYNHCDQRKTKAIEIAGIKFIRWLNESLQQDNTCNQIEKICINDLRSFIETQKETNLSGVSWNDLIKDLNLDLMTIDKSLSPCLFIARYEKLYNEYKKYSKSLKYTFRKQTYCSSELPECREGFYSLIT